MFEIKGILRTVKHKLSLLLFDLVVLTAPGYINRWTSFEDALYVNCDNRPLADRNRIDIVTVAFNNEEVIAHQIRLLDKYLLDSYCYTVADNSSDPAKQDKIMKLCEKHNVPYIKLRKYFYSDINPNISHGTALNWIYKNYIYPRNARYFGFIDHDIFPVSPTKITDSLQSGNIYGLVQEREKFWYLWAGFCFFKFDYVKDLKVNFMTRRIMGGRGDTGAGNWGPLYSKMDKTRLPLLKHEYGRLREGDDPQADFVEYIGDWLHTINASNWKKVREKDSLVSELLNQY